MPPRARMNYGIELGAQRCRQIISEKRPLAGEQPFTGCWFWGARPTMMAMGRQVWTKRNRDLHLTGRQAQTPFLIHIVAFVARTGSDQPGVQISHRCDNRHCFNPNHLVAESPHANNSRKGCAGPIACSAHGHIVVDLCAHEPRCIRPPRDDVFCCLSLKESDPSGWAS